MKCYKCKANKLAPVEVTERVDVAGHKFTGKVPAMKCDECGEVLLDGPGLERFELLVAAKLAEAGEVSGEAFKFMRKAAGLRATDLAALLAVTGETVSRWETGAMPMERRAAALLGAIVAEAVEGNTATLDRLRALQTPAKLPKVVRLDTQAA